MGVHKRLERAEALAEKLQEEKTDLLKRLNDTQRALDECETIRKALKSEVSRLEVEMADDKEKYKEAMENLKKESRKAYFELKEESENDREKYVMLCNDLKQQLDFLLDHAGYFLLRKYQKQFGK